MNNYNDLKNFFVKHGFKVLKDNEGEDVFQKGKVTFSIVQRGRTDR